MCGGVDLFEMMCEMCEMCVCEVIRDVRLMM